MHTPRLSGLSWLPKSVHDVDNDAWNFTCSGWIGVPGRPAPDRGRLNRHPQSDRPRWRLSIRIAFDFSERKANEACRLESLLVCNFRKTLGIRPRGARLQGAPGRGWLCASNRRIARPTVSDIVLRTGQMELHRPDAVAHEVVSAFAHQNPRAAIQFREDPVSPLSQTSGEVRRFNGLRKAKDGG